MNRFGHLRITAWLSFAATDLIRAVLFGGDSWHYGMAVVWLATAILDLRVTSRSSS